MNIPFPLRLCALGVGVLLAGLLFQWSRRHALPQLPPRFTQSTASGFIRPSPNTAEDTTAAPPTSPASIDAVVGQEPIMLPTADPAIPLSQRLEHAFQQDIDIETKGLIQQHQTLERTYKEKMSALSLAVDRWNESVRTTGQAPPDGDFQ